MWTKGLKDRNANLCWVQITPGLLQRCELPQNDTKAIYIRFLIWWFITKNFRCHPFRLSQQAPNHFFSLFSYQETSQKTNRTLKEPELESRTYSSGSSLWWKKCISFETRKTKITDLMRTLDKWEHLESFTDKEK